MVKISGRLVEPADDKPRSGVTLTLSSLKNSSVVLKHATYRCVTGGNGEYSFNAAPGTYAITVSVYGVEPERVGQIRVYSDSLPGDLNSFLMAPSSDDLTPEIIRLVDRMRSEAVKAAESAKQSQQVASKLASDVATHAEQVASNKVVVEQNTQIVRTKAQQVLENMQSVAANTQAVSLMRDEVVGKTSMAQAAADTATQKAASAAEHDAAAAEYARQAQEAAQATAGALIDGGAADLSTGVYPQPAQVSGTARPTFWKVTKGGTVGGVDYGVGDTLIYTVAGSGSYYKIDNTESVTSVQGEKGAVTLTPGKIGAEPVGAALASMQQHVSAPDPHAQYAKTNELAQVKQALSEVSISLDELKGEKLIKFGGGAVPAGSGKVFLRVHSKKADNADFLLMGKLIVHENGVKNIYQVYVGGNSRWGVAGRSPLISFNSIQVLSRQGHVSSKVELSMLTDGIDDGIVRLNLSNNDSTYQIYFDFYVEWFTCSGHVEKITSNCGSVNRVSSVLDSGIPFSVLA